MTEPELSDEETRTLIDYARRKFRGALAYVARAAAGSGDHGEARPEAEASTVASTRKAGQTELADGEEAAAMSDDKLHIDPAELRAKVFKDRITPGDWRVEKIDEDSGYEDIQVFTGPDARWQAIRYAGDKYACST